MVDRQIDIGRVNNRNNIVQMIDVRCDGATASRNAHTTPNITISDALKRQQWPDSRSKAESSSKNLKPKRIMAVRALSSPHVPSGRVNQGQSIELKRQFGDNRNQTIQIVDTTAKTI